MTDTAVAATLVRADVAGGEAAWKLTAYSEVGAVIQVRALATRELSFDPREEASEALSGWGYTAEAWTERAPQRWNTDLTRP